MRPECAWSMSTVGLTAQETSFPIENPFLRGGHCPSMAGSKTSCSYPYELLYFSMNSAPTDQSSRAQLKGPPPSSNYEKHKHSPGSRRLPPKKSRPSHLLLSGCTEPSTPSPSPVEDDQVVPSFQRLSMCSSPPQTPGRCSKPLPPIPPPHGDASPEPGMEQELGFFASSDESSCLVSEHKASHFPCRAPGRRSMRDCGKINYAYSGAFEAPPPPPPPPPEARDQWQHPQPRQPEKSQRRLRRSNSGPAGSSHKLPARFLGHKRGSGADRPEVPPPVPPRTPITGDPRRWSAEVSSGSYSDEDKPPKVPPRDPLYRVSSFTAGCRSLPTYANGVMPATQSFAPDPKYVSCRLQRQNSEGSPGILPIMRNGEKISDTHYELLPARAAFANLDVPDSDWGCPRRRAPVDLV